MRNYIEMSQPEKKLPPKEVPMITIPLWVFEETLTMLKFGADNAGDMCISTGLRSHLELLEKYKTNKS